MGMQIQLNFEAGNGVSTKDAIRMLCLLTAGPNQAQGRVEVCSYNGPDGDVIVETIVAKMDVSGIREAFGIAYFLAVTLGQDCVAMQAYDGACGYLVGPNAAKWGEFNPKFFIEF